MTVRNWSSLFFLVLLTAPLAAAEIYMARVTYVTDGDTVWVRPEDGSATRKLRLQGIDAPEICQPGGADARAALRTLVLARRVQVRVRARDDYGRGLAQVRFGSNDVAAMLVRGGHAWPYRWRSKPGQYAAEEAHARQARLGLFAADQPELPDAFRKRHGPCDKVKP